MGRNVVGAARWLRGQTRERSTETGRPTMCAVIGQRHHARIRGNQNAPPVVTAHRHRRVVGESGFRDRSRHPNIGTAPDHLAAG